MTTVSTLSLAAIRKEKHLSSLRWQETSDRKHTLKCSFIRH